MGAIPGAFSVSDQGTASYRIPIAVPPGRAGIEPNLSLVYEGVRTNGYVGTGWRLDGLSVITRCQVTAGLDGYVDRFSSAFCLDGKRLVPVSGQPLGGVTTEFRTVIDSFTKILAVTANDHTVESFRVYTKDGRILTYGQGGRVAIAPDPTWVLTRIEDRKGNTVTIRYWDGALRPLSIYYTGLVNQSVGDREIRFKYKPRDDAWTGFRPSGGGAFEEDQALDTIEVYVAGQKVRFYVLEYDLTSTKRLFRLNDCVPAPDNPNGSGKACKKPTVFQYDDAASEFALGPRSTATPGIWLDLNGDGRQDILRTVVKIDDEYKTAKMATDFAMSTAAYATPAWYVTIPVTIFYKAFLEDAIWGEPEIKVTNRTQLATGNPNEPFGPAIDPGGLTCAGLSPGFVFDYDMDGRDDIIEACPHSRYTRFTTPRPNVTVADPTSLETWIDFQFARASSDPNQKGKFEARGSVLVVPFAMSPLAYDMNGDGLQDMFYCTSDYTSVPREMHYRLRVPGGGFGSDNAISGNPYVCDPGSSKHLLDIDGNGVLELLVFNIGRPKTSNEWDALYFDRDGPTWRTAVFTSVGSPRESRLKIGDFNGDGLADLYELPDVDQSLSGNPMDNSPTQPRAEKPPVVWINHGGFFQASQPQIIGDTTSAAQYRQLLALDLGGDGRTEILDRSVFSQILMRRVLPGSGNFIESRRLQIAGPNVPDWPTTIGDLNADGAPDLLLPVYEVPDRTSPYSGPATWPTYELQFDVYYGNKASGLLKRATDGLGNYVEIAYGTSDEAYGVRSLGNGSGDIASTDTELTLKRVNGLVKQHKEGYVLSDGSQRVERIYTYEYADSRVDRRGHGWLGFSKRSITERDGSGQQRSLLEIEYGKRSERFRTNATTEPVETYVYPFAGLATRYTTMTAPVQNAISNLAQRTTVVDVDWQVKRSAVAQQPFPYMKGRVTQVFEDTAVLAQTSEEFDVDDFGNQTLHKIIGPETVTTTARFEPGQTRINNWLISLPREQTVRSTRSGVTPTGYNVTFVHNDTTGLLETINREPSNLDPSFQQTTVFHYTPVGNIDVVSVEGNGTTRSTSFVYDAQQILPTVVTNGNLTTQFRYDYRFGAPTITVDPNNVVARTAFDGFGRVSIAEDPTGSLAMTYSPASPHAAGIVNVQAALSVIAEHTSQRRMLQEFDPRGRVVRSEHSGLRGVPFDQEVAYDSLGRPEFVTRPHSPASDPTNGVLIAYDSWDRKISATTLDGRTSRYDYASKSSLKPENAAWIAGAADAFEVVQTTDPAGFKDVLVFDQYGLPIRNVDGEAIGATSPATTNYTYGPFNQSRSVTDKLGTVSIFTYDGLGRLRTQIDPNVGNRTYTYTAFDELKTVDDARNPPREFFYDNLGRLEHFQDTDGTTRLIYDGDGSRPNEKGKLIEAIAPTTPSNPAGNRKRYAYEPVLGGTSNRGLLRSVTDSIDSQNFTTTVDYDGFGRPVTVTYPADGSSNPVKVQYTYVAGFLDSVDDVTSGTQSLWKLLEVELGYRIKREQLGDGSIRTYGYEEATERLASIQTRRGPTLVQDLTYQYFPNGLVRERRDVLAGTPAETFLYDPLLRLKAEIRGSNVTIHGYDAIGNLKIAGQTSTSELGRPQLAHTIGQNTYGYDANGNEISRSGPGIPGGTQTFTYNAFDMPSTITSGSGTGAMTVNLGYGPGQERVVKRVTNAGGSSADVTTYFSGDGYQRRVVNPSGSATTEHRFRVFVGEREVAQLVRSNGSSTLSRYYLHSDLLGSSQTITDGSGNAFPEAYEPFGTPSPALPPGTTGVRSGFTGHQHDSELGLIDMKGRIYDPSVGRFLTADPIVQRPYWSQGLNRYAYVFNSPLNNVDPSGFVVGEEVGYAQANQNGFVLDFIHSAPKGSGAAPVAAAPSGGGAPAGGAASAGSTATNGGVAGGASGPGNAGGGMPVANMGSGIGVAAVQQIANMVKKPPSVNVTAPTAAQSTTTGATPFALSAVVQNGPSATPVAGNKDWDSMFARGQKALNFTGAPPGYVFGPGGMTWPSDPGTAGPVLKVSGKVAFKIPMFSAELSGSAAVYSGREATGIAVSYTPKFSGSASWSSLATPPSVEIGTSVKLGIVDIGPGGPGSTLLDLKAGGGALEVLNSPSLVEAGYSRLSPGGALFGAGTPGLGVGGPVQGFSRRLDISTTGVHSTTGPL